jgi:hypothetical protein
LAKYSCENCQEKYCGTTCQKKDWDTDGHIEKCNSSIWIRLKQYTGVGSALWEFIQISSISLEKLLYDLFDFKNDFEGFSAANQLQNVITFLTQYHDKIKQYYNIKEDILNYKIAFYAVESSNAAAKTQFFNNNIINTKIQTYKDLFEYSGYNTSRFVSECIINSLESNHKYYEKLYNSLQFWLQDKNNTLQEILVECIHFNKNNFIQYQIDAVRYNKIRISLFDDDTCFTIVDLMQKKALLCIFVAIVSDNEFFYDFYFDKKVKKIDNKIEWDTYRKTMQSSLFKLDGVIYLEQEDQNKSCFITHAYLNGCIKILPKLNVYNRSEVKTYFPMVRPETRQRLIQMFPKETGELYLMTQGSERLPKKFKKKSM